ncbi:MAG: sigma factor-like helix-turn-helix DNA-binding protein [Ignavibacteriaceae bacterium]
MNRFNTTKEELAKLSSEFNSEALPLLDKFYNTSFWILLDKKVSKKIIKQTYYEAIEYCDKTKAHADWQSWMHRIWMREIHDFYAPKENDTQTIFDFIDFVELNLNEAKTLFSNDKLLSVTSESEIINSLNKMPSVLRIPLILKEIHSLNYEKIAELIDVPDGVIATRIYRARKLFFLFLVGSFNYNKRKEISLPDNFNPIIFEKRRCALFVDGEFNETQVSEFSKVIEAKNEYKSEIFIQEEINKLLRNLSLSSSRTKKIKSKIERKAIKRFRNS